MAQNKTTKKSTTKRSSRPAVSSAAATPFTVPGLEVEVGHEVARCLQDRLYALVDLQLVLKHVHWNVVGPHFIGLHEHLDSQVVGVRRFVDEVAERIATLGLPPNGLAGALVAARDWDDYELMRADVAGHIAALDLVYAGVIADHRDAIEAVGDDDPISEDMLIAQTAELEKYQWFLRAHLQGVGGDLVSAGATTEPDAARKATAATRKR